MHTLGQIFYGRDKDGYGVLGVSPAGRPFIGAVASLCRAVGSPDRPDDIPTFLIGKREGNAALMIRACRGAADPTGRATIFFHALVANTESLRSAGLDTFAFADNGTFATACPAREPPDLVFPDVRTSPVGQSVAGTLDLPATISSDWPLDSLVRRELGTESLDRNWATFTYNPLSGFDLCVLSSYSPRKGGGTQYEFDGAVLHRLSQGTTVEKKTTTASSGGKSPPNRSGLPLLVSLAANVVLVLALLAHGGKGEAGKPVETPPGGEMTESDARGKWEAQWKSEWEESLPPPSPAMTEAEAKAKWEAQWKSEWERSFLPPPSPAMTETEARAKWEADWRTKWENSLGKEFKETILASGGVWPIGFDDEYSPFVSSIRSAKMKPDDDKSAVSWQIYQSCKACAEFIQKHFNP